MIVIPIPDFACKVCGIHEYQVPRVKDEGQWRREFWKCKNGHENERWRPRQW